MRKFTTSRMIGMSALLAASAALAACDDGREAEAETPVAEAEVSTELPETVVSDAELQEAADAAAVGASEGASQALPTEDDAAAPPTE